MLALLAAPSFALAQPKTVPVRIAKSPQEPLPQEPLPQAQELLDNLFTPYEAAQTFRGNFDIDVHGEMNLLSQIHLDTMFRYDDKGDLSGQKSTMKVVGRAKPKQQQTFVFVDESRKQKVVLVDQKAWWIPSEHDNVSVLSAMVKPLIDQVVQALEDNADFIPVVTRGVDGGRPVFILKAKKSNVFRAVIDQQTRAIRSIVVKDNISIVGTNQVFNQPLSDEALRWSASADYRQVAEGEVMPPASLGITIPGLAATPTE